MADGWKPRYKKLFGLGTVLSLLTICVPPMTSADVLMYAAYGRLQAIGRDPYEITPAEVFRGQFDPVLSLDRAAVAGHPQRVRPDHVLDAARSPTSSVARTCTTSCSGCRCSRSCPSSWPAPACLMLAHGDPRRQGRAALLTIANPLLIWAVVAGAHNEALAVMFAVAGLLFMRKNPFVAGLGIGLAGCAKVSIGLWGLAMLWAYRREPKKALLLCLGTAVPMGLAYVLWQPTAFLPVTAQRWVRLGRLVGQSALSPP